MKHNVLITVLATACSHWPLPFYLDIVNTPLASLLEAPLKYSSIKRETQGQTQGGWGTQVKPFTGLPLLRPRFVSFL